jgi:hypothetical protein
VISRTQVRSARPPWVCTVRASGSGPRRLRSRPGGCSHTVPCGPSTTTAGRPNSAALALMACSEGIILHRIARQDTIDPRPLLRVVVNAALRD